MYESIEKTVDGIRKRMEDRQEKLHNINKYIDICTKSGIINVDAKDRSHPKKNPKDRAKDVIFREVHDVTMPIRNGEVIGGNPYIATAMRGGDPNDPEDVRRTRERLNSQRPEPEITSDLLASMYKPGDAPLRNSKYGENEYCTGFASKRELDRHVEDHLKRGEFGDVTPEEYVKKGIKFLAGAATGEDLDGDNTVGYMYSDKDGNDIVCRYNPKTGEYAKGIPGWRLITYFKPKWETGYGRHNRKGSEKYYLENKEKDLSGGRR